MASALIAISQFRMHTHTLLAEPCGKHAQPKDLVRAKKARSAGSARNTHKVA